MWISGSAGRIVAACPAGPETLDLERATAPVRRRRCRVSAAYPAGHTAGPSRPDRERNASIPVLAVVAILLVLVVVFAPQVWVRRTMERHGVERPDFPGTGGEMAAHLIERLGLEGVGLEATEAGDHYDPESRTVRLSAANFEGRNLTAVAVAAHEVGHALQHARGERGLALRQSLAAIAAVTDRIAPFFFMAAPLLGLVVRSPAALLALVAIGVGLLAVRVAVHLVTLPVEFDASFGKALPILRDGGYLSDADLGGARSVLKAAAMTYVAAALASLLNLARWIRFLR